MNRIGIRNRIKINSGGLHFAIAVACTCMLLAALLFRLHFAVQLCVYLILVAISAEQLYNGFHALGAFSPNVDTLVFLGAFAALLHGIATLSTAPYYAYAALLLVCKRLGDATGKRLFGSAYESDRSDGFCHAWVSVVLFLSVLTLTVWLSLGAGIARAAELSVTVLIVCCPAGVGMLLPTVAFFAQKSGGKHGISIRNPHTLARLGRINTLTVGCPEIVYAVKPSLYDVYALDGDKSALLSIAAAIEQHSSHPFADAIAWAAAKLELPMPCVTRFSELRGKGVSATVSGDKYFLGNKKLFREKAIALPDAIQHADLKGHLPLYAAKNGCFFGMLLLDNTLKEDVRSTVGALRSLGIKTYLRVRDGAILLDGDREKVLQEPKNNATIKTMLYGGDSENTEDAFCTASYTGSADVLLLRGDLCSAYCAILLGKKACGILFGNLLVTLFGSAVSLLLAAGVFYRPFGASLTPQTALWIAVLTLAILVSDSLRLLRFAPAPYTPSEEDNMFGKVHYTMKIDGMSCTHCSARVKTALETLRGTSAEISLDEKTARVKCPASLGAEALTKAVTEAGYTVLSCERV